MHHGAVARQHLHGYDPLAFCDWYFDQVPEVRDFKLRRQFGLRQSDEEIWSEPLRMQPALGKDGRWRQIAVVSLGSAGIDPGDQLVNLPLAEPRVIAKLHAV